jgi:signal transduction histidine kinase
MLTLAIHGRTMWVGSYPHGLFRVDVPTGRIVARYNERDFGTSWIAALAIDPQKRLWVATFRGLFRETEAGAGKFERLQPEAHPANASFYSILVDRQGRTWTASSAGVAVFDQRNCRTFGRKHGIKAVPRTLAEGPDGAVWIGYGEPVGVSRLELRPDGSSQVSQKTERDGLPSSMVVSTGFDHSGRLWLGTDRGAAVQEQGGWRQYTQADGLAWNDTNFASFAAGPRNDVWVGTNRGLSHYMGTGLKLEPLPPKVMITAASFANGAQPTGKDRDIAFRDRAFHVRFTALTFQDEKQVQFRYRVAGLHDNWIVTANRDLHMPRLSAGRYRFEVEACNSRGLWSTTPATFSFRILPPWYQHPLTLGMGLLLLGFSVWGIHRWRLFRLLRQQRLLEAMVEERTNDLNEAKERSEEANRLKSEFLARMSHEIRTPMNAILGMTGIVLEGHLQDSDREHLEEVRTSGESLLVLLNDLLDISRIEAGRLPIERAAFSLRECVTTVAKLYSSAAHRKNLDFACSIAADLPDALEGDALRVRQILSNLLANAVKFTERGAIRLEVTADQTTGDRITVNFKVIDTGIGIAESKLSLIREPFRQVDGSTTRKYGGTGLGLAICDRLVSMMGGKLYVESQPHCGSTFLVEIEFARAKIQLQTLPPQPPACEGPGSYSVLLAEDNLVNQKLAVKLLTKRGHTVTATLNGEDALEKFQENAYDVVLMDVDMPVMDGLTAATRIRGLKSRPELIYR